jgi:hypothetical protein
LGRGEGILLLFEAYEEVTTWRLLCCYLSLAMYQIW